jgi:agmatine/peptidylarginine deiminase
MRSFYHLTIRFSSLFFFLLLLSCGGAGSKIAAKQTNHPCIQSRAFLTRPGLPDCQGDIQANQLGRYNLIPEYHPVEAVMVSENLGKQQGDKSLIPALLQAGIPVWYLSSQRADFQKYRDNLLADSARLKSRINLLRDVHIQTVSAWTRDWAPLFATQQRSGQKALQLVDPYYRRSDADVSRDDAMPSQLKFEIKKEHLLGQGVEVSLTPFPVVLEGGNVLCNKRICLVSAKVAENNPQHMKRILADFKKRFSQSLSLVPVMPKEPNGHIDLWAKFLSDQLLLIAEIRPETLAVLPPEAKPFYQQLQVFLNQQATGQDSQGRLLPDSLAAQVQNADARVKIVRIPLPLPLALNDKTFFRSYINSLLVNGKAILPRFQRLMLDDGIHEYPDGALTEKYELEVETIYKQAGYQVIWVNADNLVLYGGTWHCLAAQVPRL